ncbi:MAG: peptide chain release factor N(5)-glutamine methyltransferase [Chlamydiota bacterium]|nr:peptide chain release factor N(5)-glutamine methyltransferase [Chlamydiota bacterium]
MSQDTIVNILNELVQCFHDNAIACAQSDAEWIIQDILKISDRSQLYCQRHDIIDEDSIRKIRNHASLRIQGMPVQYIVGYADFFGLIFHINEHVLIPRPETEMIVELVQKDIREKSSELKKPLRILDIGTGSGNITITLAVKTNCLITAVDLSEQALNIARENAKTHRVADRIDFRISNVFDDIPSGSSFDYIVSNPPYIPEEQIQTLPIEIKQYEPHIALSGGVNGVNIIKRIAEKAYSLLAPDGRLFIEIGGSYQSLEASKIFHQYPEYQHPIRIHKDLAGEDRILEVHKRIM